jgi:hypothetical protein
MKRRIVADERTAMKHCHGNCATTASKSHLRLVTDEMAEAADTNDFATIVHRMKDEHDIRVKKWRRSMSGCAWRVYHHDGRVVNWIEAPVPRTPISLAIFLHEVGHHVIGFERYKKRCEEEYHVWVWALSEMRRLGVQPDEKVNRRFQLSMQYAVGKALRRGLKNLPEPLTQFLPQAA